MSIDLPGPVAAYFNATNARDVETMLASFDDNARVKDEGQEHHGRLAIRSWIVDAVRKYRFTVEVKDVSDADGETIVSGLVSGDFPGSPAVLRHAFRLSDGKISDLEIDA